MPPRALSRAGGLREAAGRGGEECSKGADGAQRWGFIAYQTRQRAGRKQAGCGTFHLSFRPSSLRHAHRGAAPRDPGAAVGQRGHGPAHDHLAQDQEREGPACAHQSRSVRCPLNNRAARPYRGPPFPFRLERLARYHGLPPDGEGCEPRRVPVPLSPPRFRLVAHHVGREHPGRLRAPRSRGSSADRAVTAT